MLRALEGMQPAGDYNVYYEDELIQGLSRVAYRRVSTILQTPSISSPQDQSRLVSISETDLDVAVKSLPNAGESGVPFQGRPNVAGVRRGSGGGRSRSARPPPGASRPRR